MNSNSIGFFTFTNRELKRFLSIYNQTIVPGLLTTVLYIVVFGKSLGSRIGEIKDVSYMAYIIPGLAMMNVITNAYSNSASSLLQAKSKAASQERVVLHQNDVFGHMGLPGADSKSQLFTHREIVSGHPSFDLIGGREYPIPRLSL